jgi:hypothetical protein
MGFLDKKRTVKHYDTARRQAKEDFAAGRQLLDDSVRGIDELDDDLYGQIRRGGLTPEMELEYEVARGRVADMVARDRRSMGADLLQATRRSGGTVDANTALAYQVEREGQLDEAKFDAENDISFEKARVRMERTDALYQLIAGLRERKMAVSQSERDRAAQMWLGAIGGAAGYKANVLAAATGAATSTVSAGVSGQSYRGSGGNSGGGW